MITTTLPYKTSFIKIYSQNLKQEELDTLNFISTAFTNDLNSIITNSSSHKFNNAQVNFPFFVTDTFVNFVGVNINYLQPTDLEFNPFENLTNPDEITKHLYIDHDNLSMVKLSDYTFNTSFLTKPFIINTIANFLKDADHKTFLLETPDITLAYGNRSWELELEDHANITMDIQNESIYTFAPSNDKPPRQKFAYQDTPLNISKVILAGKDLYQLKLLSKLFPTTCFKATLQTMATLYKVGITIMTDTQEVYQFK